MANANNRKNRCCRDDCNNASPFREPEMTRHSHPIRPIPPCAGEMNWISIPALEKPLRLKARTRYRQEEKRAFVYPEADGRVRVEFEEAQRAVTVGQALVLYDGDTVVGGGTICDVESEIN